MALTQRLEFRQSQSLVMTPQLMQAIKLLQLSNLDLVGLRRGGTGAQSAAGARQRRPRSRRSRASRPPSAPNSPTAIPAAMATTAARASDMASGSAGDGFEPGQEEWLNRDLGSRTEIEQTLDTGLDNVFPEEPAEAAARAAQDAAPTAYTEWGGGASQRRRLQSRSLCRRRGDARRPSRRAARARLHRPGAAPDRPSSHRSGRRGRLSAGGSRAGRRAARRPASGRRGGARGAAEVRSARRLRPRT